MKRMRLSVCAAGFVLQLLEPAAALAARAPGAVLADHTPRGAKDDSVLTVPGDCSEVVLPFTVPTTTHYTIFLGLQLHVAVPAGATSLMLVVYNPDDPNANDYDLMGRYGAKVEFVEDPNNPGFGMPVYDMESRTAASYEELVIFGQTLSPIPPGDYYFAFLCMPNMPAGRIAVKACIDGAFREIADGEPAVKTLEAHVFPGGLDPGQQLTFSVPEDGVESCLVRLEAAVLDTECMLVISFDAPVWPDGAGGFPPEAIVVDARGGYQEVCIPVAQGGFRVYLHPFNDTAAAQDVIVSVDFNACRPALGIGAEHSAEKILAGILYDPSADSNEVVDNVQYRLELTDADIAGCGGGGLAVTVRETDAAAGEEQIDFLLYVNFGGEIPLNGETGLPDFAQAPGLLFVDGTAGPGAETLEVPGAALRAGVYYVLVSSQVSGGDSLPAWITVSASLDCGRTFRRGFINNDTTVNVADAVFLLAYLFAGGPEPGCLLAADINADGTVNIADAVSLLAYLFAGAAAPAPPFEACGTDASAGGLSCLAPQPVCGAGL